MTFVIAMVVDVCCDLCNRNAIVGWKYVDDQCTETPCPIHGHVDEQRTGEFFTDIDDFRDAVQKIVAKVGGDTTTITPPSAFCLPILCSLCIHWLLLTPLSLC